MLWKDTTSYSRDAERIPTTWSLDRGGLHITVTSGHIAYRGTGMWVMHCRPWFDTHQLPGVKTAEEAQEAALALVRQKVEIMAKAFAS
jgi:hypothetical protein